MSKLLLSLFLLCAVTVSNSYACQKKPERDAQGNIIPADPKAKYEKTDIIFRGLATNTALADAEKLFEESENFQTLKVHFKPLEILKGEISENDYFLTYNGYIGGCAEPILVGQQYLVMMSRESQVFDFNQIRMEYKDKYPKLLNHYDNSRGFLSIFNTIALAAHEPRLDETMQDIREWVKKQKE